MSRNFAVTGVAVLLGLTLACTSKSSTPLTPTAPGSGGTLSATSDDSTLKVTAPTPLSPLNDVKPSTGPARLQVGASTGEFVGAVALSYRFQVFNSANVMVENVLVNGTSHEVDADLTENSRYTWTSRAETPSGEFGPWSTRASFTAPVTMFLGATIRDPLTNGKTVGVQHGGTFIPGQGWQSLSLTDAIDYDLTTPCSDNCTLEFDVTNFSEKEGEPFEKDLKWISMADAGDFGSFGSFRDSPWKMTLEQRADSDTGMMVVWRNGEADEHEDPGDHRIKLMDTGIEFLNNVVYHFKFEWATTGYRIFVNGEEIMSDGWCCPYAPAVHRISLGCYPRGESFVGAIYRNIRLSKG